MDIFNNNVADYWMTNESQYDNLNEVRYIFNIYIYIFKIL